MDEIGSDSHSKFSDICKFGVKFTHHVGRENFGKPLFEKTSGSFIVVVIVINNKSNIPISTNPTYWKLELDNQTYSSHCATFSYDEAYFETDVIPGGNFVFPIVYAIVGDVEKLRNSTTKIHYTKSLSEKSCCSECYACACEM